MKDAASNLISNGGFEVRLLADNDVLLIRDRCALRFQVDRDGVRLTYVDGESSPPSGFDVFSFLWRVRRDRLVFSDVGDNEEIKAQVAALVDHLTRAGEDILSNNKDWQADYGLAPVILTELSPLFAR